MFRRVSYGELCGNKFGPLKVENKSIARKEMQSRGCNMGQGVKLELCSLCSHQHDVWFWPFQAEMMQRWLKSIGLFPLTSTGFGSDPDILSSVCVSVCV